VTETSGAMRVHTPGGPEAMVWEQVPIRAPAPDEVLLRHTAIGVNFVDIYQRRGLYAIDLPFTPGSEGAGVVEAVGSAVSDFKPGDRVAYGDALGAYCERRLIPADKLVRVPDGIDDQVAAAVMLKGLTAEYLLRRIFPVGDGSLVLFHAAAGGVGLIACQWANALGASVIGTVGSEAKAKLAHENGCAHVINYRSEDFVARVREITGGRGVDVVYDSVGKDTFPASLDALRPRGWWVPFGQSSGVVPDFSPLLLMEKGSLFMTRPRLGHYVADRGEYEAATAALFAAIAGGDIRVTIGNTFPLAQAAKAHRAIEGRATTGSTVLIP
jgi:NADPH2:quinone reductase